MAQISIAGDTSGSVSLVAPAVSGTTTLTLPTTSGTVLTSASTITPSAGTVTQASLSTNVAGNGPAFSAYQSSTQTLSAATSTKIQFNAENFDTANCFDSTTNYRFTPTVAGYYQINYQVGISTTACNLEIKTVKNGVNTGGFWVNTSAVTGTGSTLIYFNGSTDYLEIYAVISVSQTIEGSSTLFSGFLARSA